MSGNLWTYHAGLNEQAQQRMETLITQLKSTEGITEELKAAAPIGWTQRILNTHVAAHKPDFGDGESVLTLLYEAYAECNKMDDGTIKEDFNGLYRLISGMPLREID